MRKSDMGEMTHTWVISRTIFNPSCASRKFLGSMGIHRGRTTAGEFEGGGVAPLRGSAERSEAPRGELDSPLEVSRL